MNKFYVIFLFFYRPEKINTVSYLKNHPWSQMTEQERLETKWLGPDAPDLKRKQMNVKGRKFSKDYNEKHKWMTGENLLLLYMSCWNFLVKSNTVT